MSYVPPHKKKNGTVPSVGSLPPSSLPSSQSSFASSKNESLLSSKQAVKDGLISLKLSTVQPSSTTPTSLPSLQALAFSALAPILSDFLTFLEESAHSLADFLLPNELIVALLALARRHGLLSNRTLRLLASPGIPVLDLGLSTYLRDHFYSKQPPITSVTFTEVLRRVAGPTLRIVDLRRLDGLSKANYLALGDLPLLETLIVGGSPASSSEFSKILDDLIESRQVVAAPATDDWEALADAPETHTPRFARLKCLVWIGCSATAADLLRRAVPSIDLFTTEEEEEGGMVYREAPGDRYLEPLVTPALAATWARRHAFDNLAWEDLPAAERFRLAFVLRDLKAQEASEAARRQAIKRANARPPVVLEDLEDAAAGAGGRGAKSTKASVVGQWLDELTL